MIKVLSRDVGLPTEVFIQGFVTSALHEYEYWAFHRGRFTPGGKKKESLATTGHDTE